MISDAPNLKRPARGGRWYALITPIVLLALSTAHLCGQQDERAVRTAYVFNLTKYVSWPKSSDRLRVCVFGQGNMGPALKQVLDGKISGRRKITVSMRASDTDMHECDLAYVTENSPAGTRAIVRHAIGRRLLTVGETSDFARDGGMVALVRSGDEMQIEVNLDALRAEQLEVSSRLLNLAVVVTPARGRQ